MLEYVKEMLILKPLPLREKTRSGSVKYEKYIEFIGIELC